jgi:hypothetical protein
VESHAEEREEEEGGGEPDDSYGFCVVPLPLPPIPIHH